MTTLQIQRLWKLAGRDMKRSRSRNDDRGYGKALKRRQILMVEKLLHGL